MDREEVPEQLRGILRYLEGAVESRVPAIAARVDRLRATNPNGSNDQLAKLLMRSTRRRVAGTGALSGAAAIAPGLGTVLAVGTVTSQALYALEQEIELVLGVALIYGHDLRTSERRVLEALAVVGLASGAVKLREAVMVAGGQRLAARLTTRLLSQTFATRIGRFIPLGVGVAIGAGFDWVTVTALGRTAIRYYGPGGAGQTRPRLLAAEDPEHVEVGD